MGERGIWGKVKMKWGDLKLRNQTGETEGSAELVLVRAVGGASYVYMCSIGGCIYFLYVILYA